MKKIFEDENILVTDTEASGLIVRHKKHALQITVTSDTDFIRASSSSAPRKVEALAMTSYIEVRREK